MRINLPNQITIARLVLAGLFIALLTVYQHGDTSSRYVIVALVVFIVAAATDALDGYLARKHNQVTPLGRILDPFVDKVLVCGAFILFAGPSFVSPQKQTNVTFVEPWMVVLIVGREVAVTGLRGIASLEGSVMAASSLSRLGRSSLPARSSCCRRHSRLWRSSRSRCGSCIGSAPTTARSSMPIR